MPRRGARLERLATDVFPYQHGTSTLLSKHSCSPSGSDRGMRKPRTSSDSLNRSSDHGPPAFAEVGAMRSYYAGYVLGTRTQRMAICFVARKGPRAPSVRCPSRWPTSCWPVGGIREAARVFSGISPPALAFATSSETSRSGSTQAASSPSSKT